MNTYRVFQHADTRWQVHHYKDGRLVGPIGPVVTTQAEALFVAYRLARAELIDPPVRPVWDDPIFDT